MGKPRLFQQMFRWLGEYFRARSAPRRPPSVPFLEPLEDRCVMTVLSGTEWPARLAPERPAWPTGITATLWPGGETPAKGTTETKAAWRAEIVGTGPAADDPWTVHPEGAPGSFSPGPSPSPAVGFLRIGVSPVLTAPDGNRQAPPVSFRPGGAPADTGNAASEAVSDLIRQRSSPPPDTSASPDSAGPQTAAGPGQVVTAGVVPVPASVRSDGPEYVA